MCGRPRGWRRLSGFPYLCSPRSPPESKGSLRDRTDGLNRSITLDHPRLPQLFDFGGDTVDPLSGIDDLQPLGAELAQHRVAELRVVIRRFVLVVAETGGELPHST